MFLRLGGVVCGMLIGHAIMAIRYSEGSYWVVDTLLYLFMTVWVGVAIMKLWGV